MSEPEFIIDLIDNQETASRLLDTIRIYISVMQNHTNRILFIVC